MTDKAWKSFERYIAKQFNVNRIPVLGKEDADIITPNNIWIDAKLRREVPVEYYCLLEAAWLLGYSAIQWQRGDEKFIAMRLPSLVAQPDHSLKTIDLDLSLPATPIKWLDHIAESAPEGYLPCIVMAKPRMRYCISIAVLSSISLTQWLEQVRGGAYDK